MSAPDTVRASDQPATEHREPAAPLARSRSKRPYVVTAAVLAVAVAGGGAAAVIARGDAEGASSTQPPASTATAPITRGDVVDTESVDGKLTYSDSRPISASALGTVTWAPAVGATITRGKSLLTVDNKPITLMYGSLPLYRTLTKGVDDGPDVKQLEANLKALGYGDNLTVDTEFTSVTAAAVKDWQEDRGLKETGSVDAGQVVFESGPVRVSAVNASKGSKAGGGAALTVTAVTPGVTVKLDASKQDLVKKGATVEVELPAGNTVRGRIASIGTVATTDRDGNSTIDVGVSLPVKGIGHVDEAPVSVDLESRRAKDVLSVPVEALLGLREGGFGVEVIEGSTTRVVAVTTGTYGGGRVEISGDGLREGMKVGVPGE
jgi:peptidoglycan hydrolase-like protein with peptidoglycan-binding domain